MLQPIKTFFNYLQKNANTPSIFRLSTDLNMTEEKSSAAVEDGEGETFDDPLTDPLAIDDDLNLNGFNTDGTLNNEQDDVGSVERFVFVDIEKLKSKSSEKIENEESSKDDSVEIIKEIKEQPESEKIIIETDSVKSTDEKQNDNVVAQAINVVSSEVDTDEVDGSASLEIRSDGSDSGYAGSDTRSILELEKNLATLTPGKSSLKRKSYDNSLHEEQPKKVKQGINFGNVTVFYFPRCQGFGCVPTQGGSTLGMSTKHVYKKTFTLIEHANEQRRINRLKLARNELNTSSSSSDDSKSEDEFVESLSEADSEVYGFLQPVTARQRRAILKAAGVRKIDLSEKDECRQLRISREVCGCTCRSYCDPDTCECSLAGIKCQVDRMKPREFPCGCNRDGCGNVNGRIEFNPSRVKTHFIHTIMRLELEKRQELSEDTQQHSTSSKWWTQLRASTHSVHPNNSNNNYNTFLYSNGIPLNSSQSPTKIPSISTVVNQESLDLHYAYREEYSSPLSLSTEINGSGSSSTFNSSDYANYNCIGPSPHSSIGSYHNNYQSAYQTHQNYNSEYSNYTNNYHMSNVNSYSYSSMHNGTVIHNNRSSYIFSTLPQQQPQHIPNQQEIIIHNLNSLGENNGLESISNTSDSRSKDVTSDNLKEPYEKSQNDTVPAH